MKKVVGERNRSERDCWSEVKPKVVGEERSGGTGLKCLNTEPTRPTAFKSLL